MAGYIRQSLSQIQDGQIVNAAPINAEYNTLESAFSSVSGHRHDGTSAEGAPITTIGPTQNVNATSTELYPRVDNFVSLGTSALQFKDLFVKGASSLRNTTVTGTLSTTGNTSIGGTLSVTGNTTLTGALTATTSLTTPVVNATTSLSSPTISATTSLTAPTANVTTSLTTPVVNATTSVTTPTVIANVSSQGYVFTGLGSGFRSPSTGTVEAYVAGGNKVTVGPTNVTVVGNLVGQNTLAITGASTLTGNTSVGGTFSATGASTLSGGITTTNVTASGNTTVGGTLGVTGASTLNGGVTTTTATATGNVTIGGTLGVTGNTTLSTLTAPTINTTDLTVNNKVVLNTGTPSAPSLTFTGDLDTGICSVGANTVALVAGGVLRAAASTNGLEIFSGQKLVIDGKLDFTNSNYSVPSVVVAGGTANALTAQIFTEQVNVFWLWPTTQNTGAMTLSVNGAAALPIRTPTGVSTPAGYARQASGPFQPLLILVGAGEYTAIRAPEKVDISGGYYTKFSDGTMSYVQEASSTEGITTASGSLFSTSANQTWTLDATFTQVNYCGISFLRTDRDGGVSIRQRGLSNILYRPWCTSTLTAGSTYLLELKVDGRWF